MNTPNMPIPKVAVFQALRNRSGTGNDEANMAIRIAQTNVALHHTKREMEWEIVQRALVLLRQR